MRTCLLLALAIGGLGLALRTMLPVTPADAAFRQVVRDYGAAPHGEAPGERNPVERSGNTRETSAP